MYAFGRVGGEVWALPIVWVGGLEQDLEGWGGVMSGLFVYMAGSGICILC